MTATGHRAWTKQDTADAVKDIEELRHWSGARCWCEQVHDTGTAGLVPPPWDRQEGTA